ncbi:MAG: mechanosensitive ion channel family protein [Planctomycetota bacterium]|nr:mechanosensitive ion channel family protein [Planctomycetota bacterium]
MTLPLAQTTQAAEGAWYSAEFLNNAVWQWAVLLGVLLVTFIVGKIISFFLIRQGQRLIRGERFVALGMILRSIAKPTALLIFAAGLYSARTFMRLDNVVFIDADGNEKTFMWLWTAVCQTIAVIAAGWCVYRLVDVLEMFLLRLTSRTHTQLDDQLVPIVRKTLRVFVIIVAGVFIAQNIFHWNIGALLAGLGLGGLAFAFAAKDTLANFFGSVTIFTDRPFQMGERVMVGDHDGIIEEVGFRSTRVRTLTGHLVTIPNSVVANSPVENVGRRPYIRRVLDVTVTYDTPPEKVARAVEIIREMLDARKDHFPADKPGRVYFNEFNPASLNIVVYYWFTPPEWWEYLEFTYDFNMELLRRFNEENIEFAFPTQTLYVKGNSEN